MVYPPESKPYRPYGAALELFGFKGSEMCLGGPAGTGKSRACLEKLNFCMERFKGSRALMLRQTRASLTDTALVTFEQEVLPDGSPLTRGPKRDHRHSYRYENGSEIVLAGLDEVTKIMSSEYDLIYIQEMIEVSEDDYEMVTTRLRGRAMPYRQLIGDTNPGSPAHWIKKREEKGDLLLRPTVHEDNPILYDPTRGEWTLFGVEYMARLEKLTGHRKDRMKYGRWVKAEGARFQQLDERIHKFRFFEEWPSGLPSSFIKLISVDWGTRAPYCCLWIAIDFDRNPWVFREDYRPGLTSELQAQAIVERTASNEIIRYAYADPACWAKRKTQTGQVQKSDAEYYQDAFEKDNEERKSRNLPERFGSLIHGYNESRRMAFGTIDSLLNRGNGYPDLRIEEKCVNLWNELEGAVWDTRGVNPEKKEDIDPSCPDHAITALYYALHTYYDTPEKEDWGIETITPGDMMRAKAQKEIEDARRAFTRSVRNRRY